MKIYLKFFESTTFRGPTEADSIWVPAYILRDVDIKSTSDEISFAKKTLI